MSESRQISEYDEPSNAFFGVRFVLYGFDSVREEQVRAKLFEGGGVDAVNYGPDCSHIIVDKIVCDDPICVAAQRDDKILVTELWVDHSWEVGVPVDPNSIMYKPVRDLNGIPGAKSLVMCLTGYQRHDRDDIMTMVSLMGATFSKPLVANRVTHLICYKFEGEKYELGRKIKTIKLVNHRWLQDSLKAWELLPEADYAKSGYELEMEAEAKDSEEETEDVASFELQKKNIISPQNTRVENKSILRSAERQGVSRNSTYLTAFESFSNVGNTCKTQSTPRNETDFGKAPFSRVNHDEHPGTSNSSCARSPVKLTSTVPSNVPDGTLISEKHKHVLASASESAKKSVYCGLSKSSSKSMKASLPLSSEKIENNLHSPLSIASKPELGGGLNISLERQFGGISSHGFRTPLKETLLHPDEGQTVSFPSTKKQTVPGGSSRSPVLSHSPKSLMRSGLATKPIEMPAFKSSIDASRMLACVVSPTNGASYLREEIHGGFVIPSEKNQDEIESCAVKTPSKGASYPDEEQTSSLPGKRMTVSGGCSKSKKQGHSPKISMGNGFDTKPMEMPVSGSPLKADVPPTNVSSCLREEVCGVLNMPSDRDHDGVKTGGATSPLKESLLHLNEKETSSLPGNKNMTIPRGSSKSRKLSRATQTLAESGLDNKSMERPVSGSLIDGADHVSPTNTTSHLREDASPASREATTISTLQEDREECNDQILQRSRGRPKKQRLPDLNVESPLGVTKYGTGGENIQRSDLLGFEPPFPCSSSKVEKLDEQADVNSSEVYHSDAQIKPLKKKMLARKTLGSRPSTHKGSTAKYKGLISTALMNELTNHSNRVVTEDTNNASPAEKFVPVSPTANDVAVGEETEAPEREELNEFDKVSKNSAEVEEPHTGKPTHKRKQPSEKTTQIKKGRKSKVEKGNEATKTVCSRNMVLPESKSVGVVAGKKVTEGKKQPRAKSKRNKLNDPTGESKQDEGEESKAEKGNEATKAVCSRNTKSSASTSIGDDAEKKVAEGKKRPLAKSKRNKLNDPIVENKEDEKNTAAHSEDMVALAGNVKKGKKRPLAKSKINELNDRTQETKQDENKTAVCNDQMDVLAGKTSKRSSKKSKISDDVEKENEPVANDQQAVTSHEAKKPLKNVCKANQVNIEELNTKSDPAWFILSGHKLQRKEFQQVIKRLKGRVCRDTHNWSYQATHFIVPDPLRRTEKFFAAAASGSWILKTDYLTASNEAGRLLAEEPYEWHKKCLTEDGAINLEAPRKWRLLRERTGHGAFYGMRIVIYGECIAPPLETLKRVVKAGDGTILATSPPYSRFLTSRVDFAIVSPGMPRVDMWVQEFFRYEIPCISADYLVEYVCKPGCSLDRHVQYNTHAWAQRSLESLVSRVEETVDDPKTPEDHLRVDDAACQVCGSRDRGEEMLICGDESGTHGCGVGTHIDCLDPPLNYVPEEDWFCGNCCRKREAKTSSRSSRKRPSKSKK